MYKAVCRSCKNFYSWYLWKRFYHNTECNNASASGRLCPNCPPVGARVYSTPQYNPGYAPVYCYILQKNV